MKIWPDLCDIIAEQIPPQSVLNGVSMLQWERSMNLIEGNQGMAMFCHLNKPLTVAMSISVFKEGQKLLHVSCAYPDQLPSWEDLKMVKDAFIGRDKMAIQTLPIEANYINKHPYCLHLWAELEVAK